MNGHRTGRRAVRDQSAASPELIKEYRDSGEIPQLETPGRKPYAEYPDDLEQRILELRQRLGAGAVAIGHILRVRDDISIANNRVHAILEES